MKPDPKQMKVESYCGICDVYNDDEITSFHMEDSHTVRTQTRINRFIAAVYDIEVV
jgi:hypothetical protein